jgi:hypothetical protein
VGAAAHAGCALGMKEWQSVLTCNLLISTHLQPINQLASSSTSCDAAFAVVDQVYLDHWLVGVG